MIYVYFTTYACRDNVNEKKKKIKNIIYIFFVQTCQDTLSKPILLPRLLIVLAIVSLR